MRRYRARWRIRYRRARPCPARCSATIEDASRAHLRALKLRDYARIDYRLTAENRLDFLEANPNPDLTRHTFGRDVFRRRALSGAHRGDRRRGVVQAAMKPRGG